MINKYSKLKDYISNQGDIVRIKSRLAQNFLEDLGRSSQVTSKKAVALYYCCGSLEIENKNRSNI
jgi:hypothetical protein